MKPTQTKDLRQKKQRTTQEIRIEKTLANMPIMVSNLPATESKSAQATTAKTAL